MKGTLSLIALLLATSLSAAHAMNGMMQNDTMKNQGTSLEPNNGSETNRKDRFTTAEDQKLGSALKEQIVTLVGIPEAEAIIIIVDSGDVKLTGRVRDEQTKTKIADLAKGMKGVKSVHNKLETNSK